MSTLTAATAQPGAVFPPPSTTRVLSPDVIATRIEQRVQERNSWGAGPPTKMEIAKLAWNHLGEIMFPAIPSQAELDKIFPITSIDYDKIHNPPAEEVQITWLGHASLLVQMGGRNVLTDPIFSQRCSPSQWFGPKRYRNAACQVQDLVDNQVDVHMVLLSHNHYDHLDYASIKDLSTKLNNKVTFVVPLGLKAWLSSNIPSTIRNGNEIVELDWHETISLLDNTLKVTAVPMRHWTNRTGDRDKTLWCGFQCATQNRKFLFTGDTAWFDDLKTQVGDRYGPFDVAAIPIGAYEPRDFMKSNHINPQEAVMMMEAVRAEMAVPIHWGTFPLTIEPIMEPVELLEKYMEGKDSIFAKWFIGDTMVTTSK